jgi:thiamine pyrophosphokinase
MNTSKTGIFHLNGWELRSSRFNKVPTILLIAGGRAPSVEWLVQTASLFDEIWCADAGIDICKKTGIVPHYLVGDSDSSSLEGRTWAEKMGVHIETYPVDKEYTDLQLTLRRIGETYSSPEVVLTGCWGGRLDHTWSNIFSALWAEDWGVHIRSLCDDKEALFILQGAEQVSFCFDRPEPEIISLFALEEKVEGVSIRGTRWELENVSLEMARPYAISNRLEKSREDYVEISVDKGRLAVYLYWTE